MYDKNQIDTDAENEAIAIKKANSYRLPTPHRQRSKQIVSGKGFYDIPQLIKSGWLMRQIRKQRQLENGYSFRL